MCVDYWILHKLTKEKMLKSGEGTLPTKYKPLKYILKVEGFRRTSVAVKNFYKKLKDQYLKQNNNNESPEFSYDLPYAKLEFIFNKNARMESPVVSDKIFRRFKGNITILFTIHVSIYIT